MIHTRSLLFLLCLISSGTFAQSNDVTRFTGDMLLLAERFAQPAADGAAYQAGAGWFSSAATMDPWEFRVSFHGNALIVPQDAHTFFLQNTDMELLQIEGAQSAEMPTAFGTYTPIFLRGVINTEVGPVPVRFKGLDGVNKNYIPHVFGQVTLGLPSQTEVTIRATPELMIDGITASTYGAGIKHNLSQYFGSNYPGDFQFAVGAAYTKFFVDYAFEPIVVENVVTMEQIHVDADLWLLEAIGSKRWGIFELFGAAGVMNSTFDYEMGGGGPFLPLVNTELENLGEARVQYKGDVGFNLHVGRFRFLTMLSLGEFVNANLGLQVRI